MTIAAFSHRYRCIAVDRRGHGHSAPLVDGGSPSADLLGVLAHAKVDHCHLVGLSLGGMDAVQFAGLHPERVQRLVLADAWLPAPQMATWQPIRQARSAGVEATRAAWLGDRLLAPALRRPDVSRRIREVVDANDLSIWFRRVQPAPEPSALDLAPTVTAPTLVAVGELDLPEFHELAGWLQRTIPGALRYPVAAIPNAGHMAPMEEPAAFNAVVAAFLEE